MRVVDGQDRKERLEKLKKHAIYAKSFKKFSQEENKLIEDFLEQHVFDNEFEWSLNSRDLFLDNPNKPKNWASIWDVLQTLA
jgi:hypothetical protein